MEKAAPLRSEDVTKLQESDFFVSKLMVFSVTFDRKTKKSQPLGMTGLGAWLRGCQDQLMWASLFGGAAQEFGGGQPEEFGAGWGEAFQLDGGDAGFFQGGEVVFAGEGGGDEFVELRGVAEAEDC